MKLTTSEQMRNLDRQAIEERGISSIDLMERAASHLAEAVLERLPERPGRCRTAVFCGAGNNGGDGIGAARLLYLKGVSVRAILVGDREKLTEDAREEERRLRACGVELEPFYQGDADLRAYVRSCQAVVDALFGVGLSRPIQPDSPYAAAIELMNAVRGVVVSADIASGVEADTGRVLGQAVKADRTVTFTYPKIGHAVGDGALYAGEVLVRDIGIPEDLKRALRCPVQTVERDFVQSALPPRKPDGHKGDFGELLIVGGAAGYTGAPYLTASAAVHSGCGLVTLGVPAGIWAVEAVKCTSAMPVALPGKHDASTLDPKALPDILRRMERCDVLALGPGLGRSKDALELARQVLLETEKPVVLDADGINALNGHINVLEARRGRVTILTPHDGEFARVAAESNPAGEDGTWTLPIRDRVNAARDFAVAHGCILVLKGHRTLTATPEGNVLVNTTGNAGLAKGGSGDVLTGLIASLLCQGATAVQAAAAGVWIHGRAGDMAAELYSQYAMTPSNVIAAFADVFLELEQE